VELAESEASAVGPILVEASTEARIADAGGSFECFEVRALDNEGVHDLLCDFNIWTVVHITGLSVHAMTLSVRLDNCKCTARRVQVGCFLDTQLPDVLLMCSSVYIFTHMDTYGERLEAALSTQIKVELVERDMDQKDLAEAIGVERATLNRYMNGHRSMPMPTFFKVAEALGLTARVLMERAEARISQ
jgi:DNA-binding XRE family transcriptional regulator